MKIATKEDIKKRLFQLERADNSRMGESILTVKNPIVV